MLIQAALFIRWLFYLRIRFLTLVKRQKRWFHSVLRVPNDGTFLQQITRETCITIKTNRIHFYITSIFFSVHPDNIKLNGIYTIPLSTHLSRSFWKTKTLLLLFRKAKFFRNSVSEIIPGLSQYLLKLSLHFVISFWVCLSTQRCHYVLSLKGTFFCLG